MSGNTGDRCWDSYDESTYIDRKDDEEEVLILGTETNAGDWLEVDAGVSRVVHFPVRCLAEVNRSVYLYQEQIYRVPYGSKRLTTAVIRAINR